MPHGTGSLRQENCPPGGNELAPQVAPLAQASWTDFITLLVLKVLGWEPESPGRLLLPRVLS